MEDPVHTLVQNVVSYFVEKNSALRTIDNKHTLTLIRINKEKLQDIGDVSFPINETIWQNYFNNCEVAVNLNLLRNLNEVKTAEEAKKTLLAISTQWRYPLNNLAIKSSRCALFLNRKILIDSILKQVLSSSDDATNNNSFGMLHKKSFCKLHIRKFSEDGIKAGNLSYYRAFLINQTLCNVLNYSEWQCVDRKDTDALTVEVIVKSVAAVNNKITLTPTDGAPQSLIKCGLVCDPKTRKLTSLSTEEYLRLRSSDMHLMAMHKYGIRVKDDKKFCLLMERLGKAAVTVDLLEVKHSSPVQIIRNAQGSTKGASFILYNSARLETLLRTFEERVHQSSYAQLPALDMISTSLLREEEEWQLLFGYIFQFPNLIERVVEQIKNGNCATHLIIRFLSDFVRIFSVYYRRIRILTEVREHLMPYVYARIYLIKAIRVILNKTLALLNIEPVDFM